MDEHSLSELRAQSRKTFLAALPGLISFALLIGGIVFVFRYFDQETITLYIEGAGLWAPLALIVAKASTIVIAPLGGAPLYPLAGALFGFWNGFFYIMLGDILGATIAFWLSRLFGRRIVNYFFPDSAMINRVLKALSTFKGFLMARIGFIALPEVVSYAAGLSSINFFLFFAVFAALEVFPSAVLVALGTFLTDSNGSLIYTGVFVGGALVCAAGIALFARYVVSTHPELGEPQDGKGVTMGF